MKICVLTLKKNKLIQVFNLDRMEGEAHCQTVAQRTLNIKVEFTKPVQPAKQLQHHPFVSC